MVKNNKPDTLNKKYNRNILQTIWSDNRHETFAIIGQLSY